STRTKRYSGTNDHPAWNTKPGSTLNAFQHFVYLASHNSLIFADIEASGSGDTANTADVLFDVMTHTIAGHSGIGDCGPAGIKEFLEQHKCVQRCGLIKLKSIA
ncbi:kinase-like domain-containing protein, partial [Mycena floridula]